MQDLGSEDYLRYLADDMSGVTKARLQSIAIEIARLRRVAERAKTYVEKFDDWHGSGVFDAYVSMRTAVTELEL